MSVISVIRKALLANNIHVITKLPSQESSTPQCQLHLARIYGDRYDFEDVNVDVYCYKSFDDVELNLGVRKVIRTLRPHVGFEDMTRLDDETGKQEWSVMRCTFSGISDGTP